MKAHLFLTLPLTAALALSGCLPEDDASPPEGIIRPVESITVAQPNSEITRAFSGLVDASEGTGISFEVGGRVVAVTAKEGERYEKGAVLARLDTSELENQLRASQAQLTEAKQALRRTQNLFETGNSSKSQLESGIAAEQSAQSNYKSSEKRVRDAVLTMPYPGVIGTVSIDPQMVVNAGQSAMTIQGEGGMEFVLGVPADSIRSINVGMEAIVTLGSLPGESYTARVDSISPQVSQITTYPVILSFNDKKIPVREGMDGEAQLTLPNPNGTAMIVPVESVAALPGGKRFVWILTPVEGKSGVGSVARRDVEIGNLREDGGAEIRSGIAPGERIVTRGVHRLEPGQQVLVSESK